MMQFVHSVPDRTDTLPALLFALPDFFPPSSWAFYSFFFTPPLRGESPLANEFLNDSSVPRCHKHEHQRHITNVAYNHNSMQPVVVWPQRTASARIGIDSLDELHSSNVYPLCVVAAVGLDSVQLWWHLVTAREGRSTWSSDPLVSYGGVVILPLHRLARKYQSSLWFFFLDYFYAEVESLHPRVLVLGARSAAVAPTARLLWVARAWCDKSAAGYPRRSPSDAVMRAAPSPPLPPPRRQLLESGQRRFKVGPSGARCLCEERERARTVGGHCRLPHGGAKLDQTFSFWIFTTPPPLKWDTKF